MRLEHLKTSPSQLDEKALLHATIKRRNARLLIPTRTRNVNFANLTLEEQRDLIEHVQELITFAGLTNK